MATRMTLQEISRLLFLFPQGRSAHILLMEPSQARGAPRIRTFQQKSPGSERVCVRIAAATCPLHIRYFILQAVLYNARMPPQVPQPPMPPRPPQKESAGPIIGALIIVILLIVGGFYFWGARLNQRSAQDKLPLIVGDVTVNP